jgi:ribosomal protein S18 acetylase RimI-like enzyme
MAAVPDPFARGPDLVDIQRLNSRDLNPLLLEETSEWTRELDWDFSGSADLIRKFADQRGLSGAAFISNHGSSRGEVVGYGYAIVEDHKGLIGDVYVRPEWRHSDLEVTLFRTMIDSLAITPGIRRIESQLMLIEPRVMESLRRERFVRLFERSLLRLDARVASHPGRNSPHFRFQIEPWADHHYDMAATVISLSYIGHVDAQINDQYQTFAGARRFVGNVVQFPGCGAFRKDASFIAVDRVTGWAAGMILASFVDESVGHITQLCVTPNARGTGLGYELLRRATDALRSAGAQRITLTVTTSNAEAIRLYERVGFTEIRRFYASVWESY